MFAVIKTGGKQYTVKEGDSFKIEKIDAAAGTKYKFEEIMLISGDKLSVGTPFIKGAAVEVDVVSHGKADRIYIFKKKRRKDYRKRQGHRQCFTKVTVTKIIAG